MFKGVVGVTTHQVNTSSRVCSQRHMMRMSSWVMRMSLKHTYTCTCTDRVMQTMTMAVTPRHRVAKLTTRIGQLRAMSVESDVPETSSVHEKQLLLSKATPPPPPPPLLTMATDDMKSLIVSNGGEPYRAKQITDGMFGKNRCKDIMDLR